MLKMTTILKQNFEEKEGKDSVDLSSGGMSLEGGFADSDTGVMAEEKEGRQEGTGGVGVGRVGQFGLRQQHVEANFNDDYEDEDSDEDDWNPDFSDNSITQFVKTSHKGKKSKNSPRDLFIDYFFPIFVFNELQQILFILEIITFD